MATLLDTELNKLKNAILKIAALAEAQVLEAVKSLVSGTEKDTKGELKKTEDKIDKLDLKIDSICQTVFALQQPVASDLRFIMSAMQISNEIERIGDLAISIIKRSGDINLQYEFIDLANIPEIASEVQNGISKTNQCLQTVDDDTLSDIFATNLRIEEKSLLAISRIVDEMQRNPQTVKAGTSLIIVVKHLERISEHCTNIGEALYFMIHARSIKHEKFEERR